ncbi:hypothetical protein TSH58p_04225 [Azospirillum sp. TSH58]|uniref:DUF1850 domain-containing protein n=1 Tax=Azospirillum sp. TSH58 TaxID=664962 RepID=UPI000D60227E|nr:DUF1850 domain-containing protein [Azospirillum sp. TSH58]AWJ82795.1 hypothetical protein TSH58p_04225 [Azospirillum sp. TSH58]PWC80646.1 hypothetical protein TSH58_01410 [Azospirillum sp. TSH58]
MSVALCLSALGGAVLAALPGPAFTLSWTHSVEKTEWREDWRIEGGRLVLTEARVKGTGAGMEPPVGARLDDGWWVWVPAVPPLELLVLAASSFTPDHRLCAGGACRPLHGWIAGPVPSPLEFKPCG